MFTVNPALPHPDSDSEPPAMPLDEAILWAIKPYATRTPTNGRAAKWRTS